MRDPFLENPTEKIQVKKDSWLKAKKDKEYAEYISDLVFSDYVATVRSCITAWDYRTKIVEAAQGEIGKKRKKERENLTIVETWIKEDFINSADGLDIKIKEIIRYGFEDYALGVRFDIYGKTYEIQIPSRQTLTTKNFYSANEGKFVFLCIESDTYWRGVFAAYDEKEFADKIQTYFEEVRCT